MDKDSIARRRAHLRHVLKEIRANAGITQVELSRRLGVPQSFVSKYESGERRLDLIELEQVCGVLGVSLQWLLESYEESKP
ncbi:MAG: helix-turn-helix transcriptional regulator [Actinomycetota bacterium]